MKQKLIMTLACLFIMVGSALAQTKVTGVVTSSEDGQPVTGVSVKVGLPSPCPITTAVCNSLTLACSPKP